MDQYGWGSRWRCRGSPSFAARPTAGGWDQHERSRGGAPCRCSGSAIDPARGYLVEELRGGAYWVTDGDYQALLVTSAEGTIVIDAPPSLAPHLPAALAEVCSAPVTHLLYSHSHDDHIGAADLFGDATVIGHAEVADTLRR